MVCASPGFHDAFFAQQRQMLRQGRLRQADIERANRTLAIGNLAQDQQPALIGKRLHQLGRLCSTGLKGLEVRGNVHDDGYTYLKLI